MLYVNFPERSKDEKGKDEEKKDKIICPKCKRELRDKEKLYKCSCKKRVDDCKEMFCNECSRKWKEKYLHLEKIKKHQCLPCLKVQDGPKNCYVIASRLLQKKEEIDLSLRHHLVEFTRLQLCNIYEMCLKIKNKICLDYQPKDKDKAFPKEVEPVGTLISMREASEDWNAANKFFEKFKGDEENEAEAKKLVEKCKNQYNARRKAFTYAREVILKTSEDFTEDGLQEICSKIYTDEIDRSGLAKKLRNHKSSYD